MSDARRVDVKVACLRVLEDREAVQRGIRDLDAVADQELPNLGAPEAVTEPPLDRGPLLETNLNRLARRTGRFPQLVPMGLRPVKADENRRGSE